MKLFRTEHAQSDLSPNSCTPSRWNGAVWNRLKDIKLWSTFWLALTGCQRQITGTTVIQLQITKLLTKCNLVINYKLLLNFVQSTNLQITTFRLRRLQITFKCKEHFFHSHFLPAQRNEKNGRVALYWMNSLFTIGLLWNYYRNVHCYYRVAHKPDCFKGL